MCGFDGKAQGIQRVMNWKRFGHGSEGDRSYVWVFDG